MVTQQLLSSLIQINLKYLINLMLTCSFIIKCLNWLSFSDWFAKSEFYNSIRSIQYMMIRRSRNRCYNWWILCVSYLSRLKHPHVRFPAKSAICRIFKYVTWYDIAWRVYYLGTGIIIWHIGHCFSVPSYYRMQHSFNSISILWF